MISIPIISINVQVDQPEWQESTTLKGAKKFAESVGYPVLVRPSFVLSGAAMRVASNADELAACLQGTFHLLI
jgi:carbamoylphosphate synthase large subunit